MTLSFPSGLRSMVAAALAFSVMSALVKEVGARIPTMEVVLWRSVLVLLFTSVTLAVRRAGYRGGERGILLLRGVFGFIALSALYYGFIHLPLADATVIQYTNPVFTALLAAAFLGEGLRRREIVLALVSLGGVVLVARPTFLFGGNGAALDPVAVLVTLGGAVFSAMAYVTVRRLRAEGTMVVVLYFAGISTLGSLPAALPVWTTPRGSEWLLLLGIGVTTHLGQVFITRALHKERAGRAMAVGYLQIVFAAAWGVLFFAEIPDAWSIAGGLVIVGSTFALGRERPPPEGAPGAPAAP